MKKNDLTDRRGNALAAKKLLLDSYRAAQLAGESTREAKQAEQIAIADARLARQAEREQLKREQEIAQASEAALREIEAQENIIAIEVGAQSRRDRVTSDEAVRKAARDRRYANRKGAASRG